MEGKNLLFWIMLIIFISGCTSQSRLVDLDSIKSDNTSKDKQNLSIALSQAGKIFANKNISLTVTFINMEKETRLLNVFEPVPVFFSVNLEREDGTPILVPSAGAISFMEDSLDYITLENRGDQHSVTLNLNEILPEGLEVGIYTVSVEYHNRYGEGFKGSLKSNLIIWNVVEKTKEEVLFEEEYGKYIDNPKYCEKNTDCICMAGSGLPFIGCRNFLYPGFGGQECARCKCARGICQETS